MDSIDPKLLSVVWDIVKSLFGGLVVAAGFIFKMGRDRTTAHEKLSGDIDKKLTKFKTEFDADLKAQDARITAIDERLDNGALVMTRIEEQLKHLPSRDEISEINAEMKSVGQVLVGLRDTVNLINETLMREREGLSQMVAEETIKKSRK